MKNIYLAVSFSIILVAFCHAQQSKIPSVIPPSPTATSLGKFVDMPVGLYHGTPEINIPLFTIPLGNLTVPISLNYHAGGIKVAEIASNVGLGWALNAGGVITRSVQGLNDERGWLSPNKFPVPTSSNCLEGSRGIEAITQIDRGAWDTEPDIFYYNFNGISGKFVFDQNGNIQTIPYNKIKIEQFGYINNWKITTEDGTIYLFGRREIISNSGSHNYNSAPYPSAWYLTEIDLPNSTQKITFHYNLSDYCYDDMVCEMDEVGGRGRYTVNTTTCFKSPVISRIDFPTGKIEFFEGSYRYDVTGSKVMDRIAISNNNGLIKSFKFIYAYSVESADILIADDGLATATTAANTGKRLFLKDLFEYDKNSIQSKPPFRFEYFSFSGSGQLPDRINSKAQDYWGYYNGHNENTTLIPSHPSAGNGFVKGGDRFPVEQYAKVGTLTKITYPTGGHTQYDFEQNMADAPSYPTNYVPVSADYMIGQCHISGANEFTIDDNISGSATLTLSLTGQLDNYTAANCMGNNNNVPVLTNPNTYVYFEILNITDPANPFVAFSRDGRMVIPRQQAGDAEVTLPNGTYKIIAVRGSNDTPLTEADANFSYPAKVNISGYYYRGLDRRIGGLRIKKITAFDPVAANKTIKTFEYTENGYTSGKTSAISRFDHPGDPYCQPAARTAPDVWSCYSQAPLSLQQGGIVGYSKVTVYNEERKDSISLNGKTEYYYTNPVDMYAISPDETNPILFAKLCYQEYNGPGSNQFPYAPAISADWKKGLLIKQIDYKTNNNQSGYIKVQEVINTYKDDFLGQSDIRFNNDTTDIKVMRLGFTHYPNSCSNIPNAIAWVYKQYYFIPVRFAKLVKTEKYDYDPDGTNPIVETQEFLYNNLEHMQLTKSMLHKSDGNIVTTQNLYPLDYSDATGFIADMKAANVINKPIESVSFLTNISDNAISILKGSITIYKQSPNTGLPDKVKALETPSPIALSQFKFSNQPAEGILPQASLQSVFSTDHRYSALANLIFDYDQQGNITSVSSEGDIEKVYIWGYNKTYPVAEIIGASYNQVLNVLNQSIIDNPSTDDFTMRAELDKIRASFPSALVTTYTYKPLIGISSSTDPNNRTTYYEYDDFGRLQLIRDQDNNIVKRYCYNYQGQTDRCALAIGNTTQSGVFTRSCNAGEIGSQVTYSVRANTYFAATQSEADALAQTDINTNGQVYANAHGSCATVPVQPYYNAAVSGYYRSQICPAGQTPLPYLVNIAAGAYSSLISQAAAEQLAQQAAQAQANANGNCSAPTPTVYARLEVYYSNSNNTSTYNAYDNTTAFDYYQQVSVYIRFYSDESCTQPLRLTNDINYIIDNYGWMETGYNVNYKNDIAFKGVAPAGTSEVFIDDILPFEGFWGLSGPGGYLYFEKWKDDYRLSFLGGGGSIRPPVYPAHTPGY